MALTFPLKINSPLPLFPWLKLNIEPDVLIESSLITTLFIVADPTISASPKPLGFYLFGLHLVQSGSSY